MPPYSSLLHIHSRLVSTIGDTDKLARNALLFGVTASTPDLDLEETQWKIFLSPFYFLKEPEPSIALAPYQYPSRALIITTFLAIARTMKSDFD